LQKKSVIKKTTKLSPTMDSRLMGVGYPTITHRIYRVKIFDLRHCETLVHNALAGEIKFPCLPFICVYLFTSFFICRNIINLENKAK
jgi:hypothetical protein